MNDRFAPLGVGTGKMGNGWESRKITGGWAILREIATATFAGLAMTGTRLPRRAGNDKPCHVITPAM